MKKEHAFTPLMDREYFCRLIEIYQRDCPLFNVANRYWIIEQLEITHEQYTAWIECREYVPLPYKLALKVLINDARGAELVLRGEASERPFNFRLYDLTAKLRERFAKDKSAEISPGA